MCVKGKKRKDGREKEEKCNKLSGCNNVLPLDKLLANPTAPNRLGNGPCWQRSCLTLRATDPPIEDRANCMISSYV